MMTHIGMLLHDERERQGKSIEEVEAATHIRAKNLIAIENEDWEAFPSRTYIQGVIKKYGRYLELDEQKLIAYFRRDYEKRENIKFKEKAVAKEFTPQNKRILQIIAAGIIVAFLTFFGIQLYQFNRPPDVAIIQPTETTFKRKDKVDLLGVAEEESVVTVNGNEVLLDENNRFKASIPLVERENKVIIEARGANGKTTVIETLFIKEE